MHAKTVTFSGCVKPGSDAKAYILEKAEPIRRTTTEEAPPPIVDEPHVVGCCTLCIPCAWTRLLPLICRE